MFVTFWTFFSLIFMGIFLQKWNLPHLTVVFFTTQLSRAFQNIYGLLWGKSHFSRYFSLTVKILHQKSTKKKENLHLLPVFLAFFHENISSSAFFQNMKCILIKKWKKKFFQWFGWLAVSETREFEIFATNRNMSEKPDFKMLQNWVPS